MGKFIDWFDEHEVPDYPCPACGDGKLAVAWSTIKVENERYTGFFYCRSCCEAVASTGQARMVIDQAREKEMFAEWERLFPHKDLGSSLFTKFCEGRGVLVMGYGPEAFIANGAADVFLHLGDNWRVRFGGRTKLLRDTKGMQYLRRLLSRPGEAMPAEQLEAGGAALVGSGARQELVDDQAIRELRARLREDIDDAEREQIEQYLAAATGLQGRARRAPDEREKARTRVAHAVSAALGSLAEHLPELHAHIKESLTLGGEPCYSPTPTRTWVTAENSPRS